MSIGRGCRRGPASVDRVFVWAQDSNNRHTSGVPCFPRTAEGGNGKHVPTTWAIAGILVGQKLVSIIRQIGDGNGGTIAGITAQECANMICEDGDGNVMLDYLGSSFRRWAERRVLAEGWMARVLRPAYEFVQREEKRYRGNGGHVRVWEKYRKLSRYFGSRRYLWNW